MIFIINFLHQTSKIVNVRLCRHHYRYHHHQINNKSILFAASLKLLKIKAINNYCKTIHNNCIRININKTSMMMMMTTSAADRNNLFTGQLDRFNGVTVHSNTENCDISLFSTKLDDSLKDWIEAKKRAIWFKVSLDQSDWIPVLVKKGFKFHHAQTDYVMMYLWLPRTETCNIPPYAHTMIGVGAVVVNEQTQQILVVREKYYQFSHWKLPGGYVEPGENLVDAAIREVLEETNIATKFDTLLTLRHAHQGTFNCSDIYTVVSLKPLTFEITKCDQEIAQAQWIDIGEYLNHPDIHELNKFFVQTYLEYSKNKIKMDWNHGIHPVINKPYTVYHIVKDQEESAGI